MVTIGNLQMVYEIYIVLLYHIISYQYHTYLLSTVHTVLMFTFKEIFLLYWTEYTELLQAIAKAYFTGNHREFECSGYPS